MRRHVLGWIVGAACVGAVAVAVLATRHSSRADGSPIDPRGGWHVAWIASCLAALALSGFAVLLGKRGVLTLKTALAVAVVVQMLPLAAPLLLSRDVYIYWADARVLVVHGANPYRSPPGRFAGDPGTRAASPQWRTQTEAYGPVWAAAGSVPAAVAGTSGDAVQLGYRVLALAGVLATIAVLSWRRQGAAAAVALVGWSPTVALHFTGGGHNDAFMVAVLTSALALGSRATAGVLWPVSALVKPLAAVVLPLDLAREHYRRPRRFWIALAGASVALAAASIAVFGLRWVARSTIAVHESSPIGGVHFLVEAGLQHRYAVALAGLAFLVVYGLLLRTAWRRGRAHLGFAAAALCMCVSQLRPWYALWPLALSGLEGGAVDESAAFALAAYVLVADALPVF